MQTAMVNGTGKHVNGSARKGVNGGITSEFVTLTPAMAKELIGLNAHNQRNVSQGYVERLARDIVAGRWKFEGSPIRISKTGVMLDGQHRCHAVVLAKRSVDTCIMRGFDESVMDTIDGGRARTTADRLTMRGEEYAARKAGAASVVVAIERETWNQRMVSFADLSEAVDRHRTGIEWAVRTIPNKIDPGIPSGGRFVYGPLAYVYPINPEKVQAMARKFASGDGLTVGDPVKAYRALVTGVFTDNTEPVMQKLRRALRVCEASLLGARLSLAKPDEKVIERIKLMRSKAGV